MRVWIVSALAAVALGASGCYATKIVSVPLRVVGAVSSAVPFVGNTAHDAIDTAADAVDDAL
jgi:hypothetical protein